MSEESIRNQMTEISARHWDFLVQENLTAKEAVAFLKSGMQLRSFSDFLRSLYPEPDLEKRLISKMTEYLSIQIFVEYLLTHFGIRESSSPDAEDLNSGKEVRKKQDNIRRKVQNWLRDKNLPTNREDVFQIAFALGFDENVTNRLLEMVFDVGIHYRNEREVVYAFCLRNGQSYETARKCGDAFEKRKSSAETVSDVATRLMRQEIDQLPPGEDIMDFMLRHSRDFGAFHNTAYRYFTEMMELLTGGTAAGESCSVEFVVQKYLRMNMPENKKTSAYDSIQKMIKKYWPGVRNIRMMQAKKEDVSRKVLLLLYLVTGGAAHGEYDELDEEYLGAEEVLEEHCRRINFMMADCGMRRIDPRNPFDYLVLYSLKPDGEAFMNERMEEIVAEIFAA